MRAVIMAGGKGMRLRPYTYVLPKPLIPLDTIPILEIILRQLVHFGFTQATLTLHYSAKLIQNYFGNGSDLGIKLDYTLEESPLGSIGSLKLVQDLDSHAPFLVMNADILTDMDYGHLFRIHQQTGAELTIVSTKNRVKLEYGVIESSKDGNVQSFVEKPTLTQDISSGIYVLNPEILEKVGAGEMDFPELVNYFIAEGKKVNAYFHTGYWKDIGTLNELYEADQDFKQNKSRFLPL